VSPAEPAGGRRGQFVLGHARPAGLAAPVGPVAEPRQRQFDVGQFLLDGVEEPRIEFRALVLGFHAG